VVGLQLEIEMEMAVDGDGMDGTSSVWVTMSDLETGAGPKPQSTRNINNPVHFHIKPSIPFLSTSLNRLFLHFS
jgi:hypothetical protein